MRRAKDLGASSQGQCGRATERARAIIHKAFVVGTGGVPQHRAEPPRDCAACKPFLHACLVAHLAGGGVRIGLPMRGASPSARLGSPYIV